MNYSDNFIYDDFCYITCPTGTHAINNSICIKDNNSNIGIYDKDISIISDYYSTFYTNEEYNISNTVNQITTISDKYSDYIKDSAINNNDFTNEN